MTHHFDLSCSSMKYFLLSDEIMVFTFVFYNFLTILANPLTLLLTLT